MKQISVSILYVISLLLYSCVTAKAQQTAGIENGVAHSLAVERKASISNISYNLDFFIPYQIEELVFGNIVIDFNYRGETDLQLDFLTDESMIPEQITVNNRSLPTTYVNEHIIVPQSALREGRNTIEINHFAANDKTLNRHDDYLYTLLVPDRARTLFPCFDQPDLKARYTLALTVPEGWKVMSNAPIESRSLVKTFEKRPKVRPLMLQRYHFEESDLLPTYLFSFVAGDFVEAKTVSNGYPIEALYRRQTVEKELQMDTVFHQIAYSLNWLENYTGIRQPFKKFGIVVLPGYQFGGMEHPGVIHLNEKRIFLRSNPTIDEELSRLNLIAHETSHLWFGDLVTMRWFDDVWTKEVFANFMADKISQETFPTVNHNLNFIKTHYPLALATDRTQGTHPIQQQLDNLNRAGLLYGNIIYHKAPIMMLKLEQLIGKDDMQKGLRRYLADYSFSNATWDDLIRCFESVSSNSGITFFSDVWVKKRGLPTLILTKELSKSGGFIGRFEEIDPLGRNLKWQQNYVTKTVDDHLIPNYDGTGYGRFLLQSDDAAFLLAHWKDFEEQERQAAVMTLYENYLMKTISASILFSSLSEGLRHETNPLVASSCIGYIMPLLSHLDAKERAKAEKILFAISENHSLPSVRLQLLRSLSITAVSPFVAENLYEIWQQQGNEMLSERDYVEMTYHLAVLFPEKYEEIVSKENEVIQNEDLRREFDFIIRACHPDASERQKMFFSLLKAENRRVEPWASSALYYLNHPLREQESNAYLKQSLDALPDIQATGDIFFPADWLRSLLAGHHSAEAKKIVENWIETHPDLEPSLMNKLKEAADHLLTFH